MYEAVGDGEILNRWGEWGKVSSFNYRSCEYLCNTIQLQHRMQTVDGTSCSYLRLYVALPLIFLYMIFESRKEESLYKISHKKHQFDKGINHTLRVYVLCTHLSGRLDCLRQFTMILYQNRLSPHLLFTPFFMAYTIGVLNNYTLLQKP